MKELKSSFEFLVMKKIDERTFDFALMIVDVYKFLLGKKEFANSWGTSLNNSITFLTFAEKTERQRSEVRCQRSPQLNTPMNHPPEADKSSGGG